MRSEAKKRADNKYYAKTYTVLGCKVRKDDADLIRATCTEAGTTPNALFWKAIDDFMASRGKAGLLHRKSDEEPERVPIDEGC